MSVLRIPIVALLCMGVAAALSARHSLDGATIVNSGSTNTVGWTVAIRSNGSGTVAGRPFSVAPELAQAFLRDAQAAREARAAGGACMKSASFGTRLNVRYHGWTSPDLSCPSTSTVLRALAQDTQRIVAAARPPTGFRRIHVPLEPRRAPTNPPRD